MLAPRSWSTRCGTFSLLTNTLANCHIPSIDSEVTMQTGSYINGEWFHPKSQRLVRNLNPADPDEGIAEFPSATPTDVPRAIDPAPPSFRGGAKSPRPA